MSTLLQKTITSLALLLPLMSAHADTLLIKAEKIYTSAQAGLISNGAVLVEDGKIKEVYKKAPATLPAGAQLLETAVLTPGLIDMRTTDGLSGMYNIPADQDQDETTDTNLAGLRAMDSYNPRDPMVAYIRSYGVTTVQATPGDRALIAGQAGVFKTWGETIDAVTLRPSSAVLFNLGETVKDTYRGKGKTPSTRMANAALIRQALLDARAWAESENADAKVDLHKQALSRVLAGELAAIFTAHREDDIATALRIAREFGFRPWIAYATEGYLVREQLRAADAVVLLGPTMQRLNGLETMNATLENPMLLADAGLTVSFGTGHEGYVPKSRVLLFEMGVAVGNGLAPERAIQAATIDAATLLGLQERIGSIAVGKDADLVLFDGDPFEYSSHVQAVVIDGVVRVEGLR